MIHYNFFSIYRTIKRIWYFFTDNIIYCQLTRMDKHLICIHIFEWKIRSISMNNATILFFCHHFKPSLLYNSRFNINWYNCTYVFEKLIVIFICPEYSVDYLAIYIIKILSCFQRNIYFLRLIVFRCRISLNSTANRNIYIIIWAIRMKPLLWVLNTY